MSLKFFGLDIMADEEAKPTPLKTEILDKIAALAWNDAIKAVFKEIFGIDDAVGPMLIYAILVTIIAVILTVTVADTASKAKSMMKEKTFECNLCDFTSKIESKFIEHTIKEHAASQDKFLSK